MTNLVSRWLAAAPLVLAQLATALPAQAISCSSMKLSDAPKAALSKASPCSGRYPLLWTMPIGYGDIGKSGRSVFARSEFALAQSFQDAEDEVEIDYDPKGRPSIEMNFPKGETGKTEIRLAPLGSRGVDKGCLALEMYLPSDFNWGTSSGKLGWGLWGGKPTCLSGGCPLSQQVGWSQRNVRGKDYIKLYSYHLNRLTKKSGSSRSFGEYSDKAPMPKGQWLKIEQEVVMNTPGKADGYSRLWINGKQHAEMQKLVFRCSDDWGIRGLNINDMWGGNPEEKKNFSPKAQRMYYSDYKIYGQ